MQAGLLTELITLQRYESVRDMYGGVTDTWVKAFDARAWVRFKSGARKMVNGELVNYESNSIEVRLNKAITVKMRIEFDGQRYRILSLYHDRKKMATIMEVEGINE